MLTTNMIFWYIDKLTYWHINIVTLTYWHDVLTWHTDFSEDWYYRIFILPMPIGFAVPPDILGQNTYNDNWHTRMTYLIWLTDILKYNVLTFWKTYSIYWQNIQRIDILIIGKTYFCILTKWYENLTYWYTDILRDILTWHTNFW